MLAMPRHHHGPAVVFVPTFFNFCGYLVVTVEKANWITKKQGDANFFLTIIQVRNEMIRILMLRNVVEFQKSWEIIVSILASFSATFAFVDLKLVYYNNILFSRC